MKKDWFVNWFNTSYYHILYKNRDQAEACRFIDNLCDYLEVPKQAQILDLACGKGIHSIHLAQKGFNATGLDLAEESILKAKENGIKGVYFDVHDMRKVYKENEFDYVFNLFTSFGYFENPNENIDVLKGVALNLKKKGVFVLDFLNATKVIKNLVAKESKTLVGIEFNLTRTYNGSTIIKDIQVIDNYKEYNYQESVSAFTLTDMEEMAHKAGLKIISTFGDYNLNPFDKANSDRLVLVMKASN